MTNWTPSVTNDSQYLGHIEFQDNKGEFHDFEVLATSTEIAEPSKLVFGGACNFGFLESGFIHRADCETKDETLAELVTELETYYNDGPRFVSRIVCNERM